MNMNCILDTRATLVLHDVGGLISQMIVNSQTKQAMRSHLLLQLMLCTCPVTVNMQSMLAYAALHTLLAASLIALAWSHTHVFNVFVALLHQEGDLL